MEGIRPVAAAPEVIAAARHLFGLGYNLVAVRADKRPYGKDWRRIHPLDEVVALLEGPNCPAIGFLGGEFNRHVVALDFDNFAGETWFRINCERAGIDPNAFPTVRTPGKKRPDGMRFRGRHRYVLDNRALLTNSAGSLAQIGVDVRGRGHTVLPPSPHPDGGHYEWVEGRTFEDFPDGIPVCPDFVYDAVAAPNVAQNPENTEFRAGDFASPPIKGNGPDPTPGAPGSSPGQAMPSSWIVEAERRRIEAYARQALENARTRLAAATKGQRNNALNNEALGLGHLAHLGAFQANEALSVFMAACTDNGLLGDSGIKAVHATFWSGWNKGLTEPRTLPDRPLDSPLARPGGGTPPVREIPGHEGRQGRQGRQEGFDPGTGEVIPDLGIWSPGAADEPIPPRGWLLGNIFARGYLSSLLAAGGTGKTALRIVQALELASGRSLTGEHIFQRARILYVSLEDDAAELNRRVKAAMLHHGIAAAEVDGWLFLATPASLGLRLAGLEDGQVKPGLLGPALEAAIRRLRIDGVILDPFIKTHAVEENANSQIDFVANMLATMATSLDCAIDAPHHIAKGGADPGNAEKGRGASAFKDAARLVYTLATMTVDEAETFGVSETERRFLIRMDSAKVNIAPPADRAKWFKLIGVQIGNASETYPHGDEVQTVEAWNPPGVWEGIGNLTLNQVLNDIDKGLPDGRRYSAHNRAGDTAAWRLILEHAPDKTEAQARKIINTWVKTGLLTVEDYHDPVRRENARGLRVIGAKRPS